MNWVVVSLTSLIFLAKFVMTAWSTSTACVIRSTWSKVYAIFFWLVVVNSFALINLDLYI